jgi:hypothetical protein
MMELRILKSSWSRDQRMERVRTGVRNLGMGILELQGLSLFRGRIIEEVRKVRKCARIVERLRKSVILTFLCCSSLPDGCSLNRARSPYSLQVEKDALKTQSSEQFLPKASMGIVTFRAILGI